MIRKPGVETKQRLFKHKEEIPQGHQTAEAAAVDIDGWARASISAAPSCAGLCLQRTQPSPHLGGFIRCMLSTDWNTSPLLHPTPPVLQVSLAAPPTASTLQVQGAAEAKCQLRVQWATEQILPGQAAGRISQGIVLLCQGRLHPLAPTGFSRFHTLFSQEEREIKWKCREQVSCNFWAFSLFLHNGEPLLFPNLLF